MNNTNKLYYIHCMSSVHIGAGQGVGLIDMPIIREKTTSWPYIPGSSVKGAARGHYESGNIGDNWITAAFGKGRGELGEPSSSSGKPSEEGNAGSLVWSDSRMLAFPIASIQGTFAYVSCPMVLKRLQRDADAAGIGIPKLDFNKLLESLSIKDQKQEPAMIANKTTNVLVRVEKVDKQEKIELDEFTFSVKREAELDEWVDYIGGQIFGDTPSYDIFCSRFVVVSDEAFQYFVSLCCEVTPRIRISSDSKTVEDGGLWLEEYIPTEAILYGIVWCDSIYASATKLSKRDLLDELKSDLLLQIGGNATVGKGRVRFSFSKEGLQ